MSSSRYQHRATHRGPATHPALHIRDAGDAHVLLEAVRLNILPLIRRRLTADEREVLGSGNVFVWEEADDDGGLLRWTDGRKWSQSRMRGDFLYYEQKIETTQEERDAKAARRAKRAADPSSVPSATNRRKDRPSKPDGLTKQTYSALVYLPGYPNPRRWHVVAYFQGNDYMRTPVIESYDYLRRLQVPEGVFVSSKATGLVSDHVSPGHDPYDSGDPSSPSHYARSLAQRPDSPQYRPLSSSSSASSQSFIARRPSLTLPPLPDTPDSIAASVDRLTVSHSGPRPPMPHRDSAPNSHLRAPVRNPSYAPLSAEDRRMLQQFRVVL